MIKFVLSKILQYIENKRKVRSTGIIDPTVDIHNSWISGNVNLGPFVEIKDDVRIAGKVNIGERSSVFGPNTQIYSRLNPIIIGKYCSIARGTTLQEYNHNTTSLSTYMINSKIFKKEFSLDIFSKGPIIIGNDVWIGAHVIILSGVNIGNGAIIAANSTVISDVEPYSIVAGSPAKKIKMRFNEDIIKELENLKWWDKDIEWLIKNHDLFSQRPFTL